MNVESMPLGPLGTNCYIVYEAEEALIIDPGGDADKVIHFLHEKKLTAQGILLTHAHFDHIGGVEELRTYYNLDVYIHEYEAEWLGDPRLNGSVLFTGEEIATGPAEFHLKPGKLNIGSFHFKVVHTPGHSPGSVSFIFEEKQIVFGGDVLFQRGIGRTDLPGGSLEQLKESVWNHLYQLEDNFTVFPGHGPRTTIKEEKRDNPFISTPG
ncbi:MBL fold metallo-hydrolase [Virgibacillus ainsalahensis]